MPQAPMQGESPHRAYEITTQISPAGTYFVSLGPMQIRGKLCEDGFLALNAVLITRQYTYIWQRYRPEVVHLRFWSFDAGTLGPEVEIKMSDSRLRLPVTRTGAGASCRSPVWQHQVELTRDQFLLVTNSPDVTFGEGAARFALLPENLTALRDLASRLEPADSIANPPDPPVYTFDGHLEEGKTYHARLRYRPKVGWWPVERVDIPIHHAFNIEWVNLGRYPEMEAHRSLARELVFRVISRQTVPVMRDRWNTTIQCEILKLLQ
ncbi:MAG TPA: hypothetical protein VN345_14425 [Blastocatellia bacterium]|nr:hypothetical protein [Blastocatellia bacterium]